MLPLFSPALQQFQKSTSVREQECFFVLRIILILIKKYSPPALSQALQGLYSTGLNLQSFPLSFFGVLTQFLKMCSEILVSQSSLAAPVNS